MIEIVYMSLSKKWKIDIAPHRFSYIHIYMLLLILNSLCPHLVVVDNILSNIIQINHMVTWGNYVTLSLEIPPPPMGMHGYEQICTCLLSEVLYGSYGPLLVECIAR